MARAKATERADAQETVAFVKEQKVDFIGFPQVFYSHSGSHFKGKILKQRGCAIDVGRVMRVHEMNYALD